MKTKHTPDEYQIKVLKLVLEEEIDRNGNEYEDTNEACRYWLNMIDLITSAPDLLESLKLAVSALNQIPNTKNNEYGTTYQLLIHLENAIKKAEGK